MKSAKKYRDGLTETSVWLFPKQSVTKDSVIELARFFEKKPEEKKWGEFFKKFKGQQKNHRALSVPQLLGLVTKKKFYAGKGNKYDDEKVTSAYKSLMKADKSKDIEKYNCILSEQVLKVKIHAITDTNNNMDYKILPVVFMYKVLKELKKQGVKRVQKDVLYTYVLTCKEYSQWKAAVKYIKDDEPACEETIYEKYKQNSRMLLLITNHVDLFIEEDGEKYIKINQKFEKRFDRFLEKYDPEQLHKRIEKMTDDDYKDFLYNVQGFNINLIDEVKDKTQKAKAVSTKGNGGKAKGKKKSGRRKTEKQFKYSDNLEPSPPNMIESKKNESRGSSKKGKGRRKGTGGGKRANKPPKDSWAIGLQGEKYIYDLLVDLGGELSKEFYETLGINPATLNKKDIKWFNKRIKNKGKSKLSDDKSKGNGYDIKVKDFCIEVKTSKTSGEPGVTFTTKEIKEMKDKGKQYLVVRVRNIRRLKNKDANNRSVDVGVIKDPYSKITAALSDTIVDGVRIDCSSLFDNE